MLIGREPEQRIVDQLVSGARIGSSGVLAITGEPGVGKTSLLRWAESRLDGFRVLRATGTEPEQEVPFAGLLAVLHPAIHLLDSIAAPQAAALSAALAMREGSAGDRFAIGAATLSLICRYAEEGPVAVILDDVQLLDRPSASALTFAARRLSSDPVAILIGARHDEAEDLIDGLDRLTLTGLDLRAARSLVDSVTTSRVTSDWLAHMHQLTGGNPLAMTELADEPLALAQTGSDVPPPLSTALATSFDRRVGLLAPAERSVVLVAVVANGDLRLTAAVCASLDLDPEGLAAARQAGLVDVIGGEIIFRHPLLRAAIYSGSDNSQRRRIHAAVADALPEHDVDRRAWHLSESLWMPDASVAAMLEGAGDRAAARSAYAVASTAYERAARLSPDLADVSQRLLAAAANAWAAGLAPRAVALLDELEAAPLIPSLALSALELRAGIAVRSGSVRQAVTLLQQAAASSSSANTRAVLLAEAVTATLYLADGVAARRLVELLVSAVSEATSTRARAFGTVAAGMAKVLGGLGGIDELRAAIPLLAKHSELWNDARGASWRLYVPLFIRDAATGNELRAGVDEARARAGVGMLPGLLFLVARDEATSRAWARAAANYTEAIRLARDTGQTTELAMSLAGLAWLESRTGQEAECRAHAEEALVLCRRGDIHWGEAWALFALGDLELARGEPAAAVPRLRELEALLLTLELDDPDLSPSPEIVDALLRLGRFDDAAEVSTAFVDVAEAKGQPWSRARAQRCLGMIATDDFDEPFRAALVLHDQTPDVFETARTSLAYGARLRRSGRRVESREHLRAALAVFTDLGAEPWADQAAVELDLTGERVPPRAAAGIAALTPQELQVALLLADGRTTREAAAALFLSPKTVEYHLRKVYTKLGVRTRDGLGDAVLRG